MQRSLIISIEQRSPNNYECEVISKGEEGEYPIFSTIVDSRVFHSMRKLFKHKVVNGKTILIMKQ